jgi:membrane protein
MSAVTLRTDQAVSSKGPFSLEARCWWRALKDTVNGFRQKNLGDRAAGLTYYAVLSLFPTLIVFVALLGLLGQYPNTTDAILNIIDEVGPSSAVDTFRGPIEGVVRSKGGAGALLGVGLVVAMWSASGYVGAFMRASNEINGITESRPFWKLRPLHIAMTLLLLVLMALLAVILVLTGDLARAVGDQIGLRDTVVHVWSIAKWPLLVMATMAIFATLYYAAPSSGPRGFRWITPGGALGVLLWLAASAGFALYVSHVGDFNATYGSLGAVIVFLVWLWIWNAALLLGVQFNVALERTRRRETAESADRDLNSSTL